MFIEWKHTCFLCNHPIQFHIHAEDAYEYVAYHHYRHIYNPIPLFMNLMYYKFINKRVRRVCTSCFIRYKKPSVRELRDREIGKRIQCIESTSLTRDEVVKWIEEMHAFMYPSDFDAP